MKYLKIFESFENITPELVYSKLQRDCPKYLAMLKECYTDNTEMYDLDDSLEVIKYFIDEVPMLYRGSINIWEEHNIESKTVRKNRRSKDTKQHISDEIDSKFNKKWSIKPRSEGVFATSKRTIASHYGYPYMFFPMNDYKFIWSSEIYDLFDVLRKTTQEKEYSWYLWETDEYYREKTLDKLQKEFIENEIDKGNYVTTYDLMEYDKRILDDMNKSMLKQKENWFNSLTDKYTFNKNLCRAIGKQNELTFIVDEYYLIKTGQPNSNFELELKKLIFDIDIEIPKDI